MSFVKDLLFAMAGKEPGAVTGDKPRPGAGMPAGDARMRPYRGTTSQVCGLWPFVEGGNPSMVGAPMGRALDGSGTVCFDPISWFEKGLITAPSAMVFGLNGLGKSSMVRHMLTGLAGYGVHTLALGDIKPDYVDLIRAFGGQVIDIGPGSNGINPLDAGNVEEAARLLEDAGELDTRDRLLASAHERKKQMVASLIQIIRRQPPSDREETILDAAITILEDAGGHPVLADLLQVIRERPESLALAALDRGSPERYQEVTEPLEASLMALIGGRFGSIFSAARTTPMMMDRSVVFDVHALRDTSSDLEAAVLLACWSYGFATVEIAQTLADAGVAPRERFAIVMDELWRILRASSGLVERIDALTRLNRTMGVAQLMVTHSMADFNALESEADRLKALGFVERSKMIVMGGLPQREMELIEGVMSMSRAERELLSSWNAEGTYDPRTGRETAPPGQGKFLLKTSNAPGTAFQTILTADELNVSNTNQRWEAMANGRA